ncbi:MAG: asparaginase domain-containing protein [Pseudomonadota bacterium]
MEADCDRARRADSDASAQQGAGARRASGGGADRARLCAIYAGGTIGAAGRPLAPLSGPAFRAAWDRVAVPALAATAPPAATDWAALDWTLIEPAIDSTDATPADWARLADAVLAAAQYGARHGAQEGIQDGPAGAMVLHGTDTLAQSAAAIALLTTEVGARSGAVRPLARLALPWAVTGSMQPLFDPADPVPARLTADGDAGENLAQTAAFLASAAPGTPPAVVFGGRQLGAARAVKRHTAARAAFGESHAPTERSARLSPAPPSGAVAAADPARLRARLAALAPHLGRRSVVTLAAGPDGPGRLAAQIDALVAAPSVAAGALLLAGHGSGNLPGAETLGPAIARARARGLPVLVATQVPEGGTDPASYAAGAWTAAAGAASAGAMSLAAAQAKLHVALALAAAEGWDGTTLDAYLATDIAGEGAPGAAPP